MELTFTIAFVAFCIFAPITVLLFAIAIIRDSAPAGWACVIFLLLALSFGGMSVGQANEESDEDYEAHKCITVNDDNLSLEYNGIKYVVDTDYVVLCEIPR